jgi:tetratricopeptide (TPR) repeat protein
LSFWCFRQGRRDEAEVLIREVLERGKRTLGADHPDYLVWVHNMSHLLRIRGKMDEAEAHIREVLETRQQVLGKAHPDTLLVLWDLASFVDNEGRSDEAERHYTEGVTATVAERGEADQHTLDARARLARFYREHDRADEARIVVRAGLAAMKSAAVASDDAGKNNAYAWELLTCKPEDLQDPANALVFALSAAELSDRQNPDILDTLALAHHRTGDHAQAVEVATEALGLIPDEDNERRAPFETALETYRRALSETPPD